MGKSIDRAHGHYSDGDYPKELPSENGGTHIGMYLAWIIQRGLASAARYQASQIHDHAIGDFGWPAIPLCPFVRLVKQIRRDCYERGACAERSRGDGASLGYLLLG